MGYDYMSDMTDRKPHRPSDMVCFYDDNGAKESTAIVAASYIVTYLGEIKVGQPLPVECHVPSHCDVLPALALLHRSVVVCLQFDQRLEDALELMDILVPAGDVEGPG